MRVERIFLVLMAVLLLGGRPLAAGGPTPAPAELPRYTGPGSCSSVSCHGSVQPRQETRVWQNEYSVWVVEDKHAKAFAALSGPVSQRMARLLGLGAAETAPPCLACHALAVPADQQAKTFDLSDGVSCESCHGPAATWLGPHTTRDWTHAQSLAAGMVDTKDLLRRAEKCLSCHLGTAEKSVSHELLAAGHPPLLFELDSYSAVMPRHWKEPGDKDPFAGARAWATGQAVQLRESLEQLARRAQGAAWPDYAELECFSCHHNLTRPEQSWRQERGYPARRPGAPPWNTARYAVLRVLARQVNREAGQQLDAEMEKLTSLMSRLNADRNEVAATASRAAALADRLARQVPALSFDQALALRLLRGISAEADSIAGQGEQAAEQAAMSLDSLFIAYAKAARPGNEKEIRAALDALFQQLQDPSAYRPEEFARQLRRLHTALP